MKKPLPKHTQVAIIGGGVIGCSIAYHLAKEGWTDVVLLERKQLTCGTTWHAAGSIGQFRDNPQMSDLARYTADLYRHILEKETGLATGYKANGSLNIATDWERFEELKRAVDVGNNFGCDMNVIGKQEIENLWPLMNTEDVIGGVWLPNDAQANPIDCTMAFAKAARNMGVQIIEGVRVLDVIQANGKAQGVSTEQGDIQADFVINCGGLWGRKLGKEAGVNIPLHGCEHFYVVTEKIEGLNGNLPIVREQSAGAYYKEEAGALLIGAFEPKAKPWGMDGIPADFCFDELAEDWDHLMPVLEGAMHRVPIIGEIGIRKFFNGPESFTPDDRFHIGEAPELKNYFVAAGLNSIGLQSAGTVGKLMADWLIKGYPPAELWGHDLRRMFPFQNTDKYLKERVSETLGLLYANHFPYRQYETSRNVRHLPLHEKWEKLNACFGEVSGWERPNWFAPKGVEAKYKYSFARQNWFDYCAEEVKAVRENVGLIDLSSFAKFDVFGKDALSILQNVCANNVDVAVGRMVYTQWLNERGGIEADLTVIRTNANQFRISTGGATAQREWDWLKRHISEDAHCFVSDVTAAHAVLGVMGPNSRALLSSISNTDFSNQAFPFATVQEIEIGCAKVLACRITYVGELGWELVIPAEFCRHVFDVIWEAGNKYDLKPIGMHAVDNLRLEKGYRHWGDDIADGDTPLEAGLAFACKLNTDIDFIGRTALEAQKETGLTKRLVQFNLMDSNPLLFHNEPVFRNGEAVGYLTSGGYGHTLGAAIGMGYVKNHHGSATPDWVKKGDYQILVSGVKYKAIASLRPLYDPTNLKVKGEA
jgi:4-methylaminobutanoate oxidase (formaldehyde-forming)